MRIPLNPLEDQQMPVHANQWLQELYMQVPVAIGVYTGHKHVIEFANPLMCEIWDRKAEHVMHKPLFEALPEVAGQGYEEILQEVLSSGKPFSGNELPVYIKRNGELALCYFNILYKAIPGEDQQYRGITQVAIEVTHLVKARQNAERNEEMLKLALRGGNMGTWHHDFHQKKSICSVEFAHILGYTSSATEWSVPQYLKHVLAEDRQLATNSLLNGMKEGEVNCEFRIKQKGNAIRWIRIIGKTSYNLKGHPISMSGIIMDITDQKKNILKERQLAVERAAREEAERQNTFINNLLSRLPALICTFYGPKFIFKLVNPQYQRLFPGRDLKGKPLLEALPELKDQPLLKIINDVYQTGQTFSGTEMPFQFDRNGNGQLETGYFNITYQALRDTRGKINGILVFAFEVTQQVLAIKQAENSEANLRIALEAGKMGTWHLDLIHNSSTRSLLHDQIFGYHASVPEWKLETFISHVVLEDRDMVMAQFDLARKYGDLRFETRIIGNDNRHRWISVSGLTFYEKQKPIRMAGVITDITERKMVEEKLKELTEELAISNQELTYANEEIKTNMLELSQANHRLKLTNADLDNFVYTASHDLKTPISNIEGLMRLLIRNLPEDSLEHEGVKKPVSLIEASIDRFKNTILELTNIARLQKDEAQINPSTDLGVVVDEVLLDLEVMIQETESKIETSFKDCPRIPLSHKNLKSVVHNLLSNAIKYRSPKRKPQINISCSKQHQGIVLSVSDNGLGLKQKDLNKIFSMFTRMHTHVEGSGVGLYLVKRIVDNIGGKLDVSSNEDAGTTFTIVLPFVNE